MCRAMGTVISETLLEEGEIEEGEIEEEEEDDSQRQQPSPQNATENTQSQTPKSAQQHQTEIDKARELIGAVNVHTACSSLAHTCLQLFDSLVILRELSAAAANTDATSLVGQIVNKIRVLFLVYDAMPKEQKLQAAPSLLKLSGLFAEALFNPRQSQELQKLAEPLRNAQMDKPKENGHAKSAKPAQDTKLKPNGAGYIPWDQATLGNRDIASSYQAYASAFSASDLPSPTPSEEDEAARYGKKRIEQPAIAKTLTQTPFEPAQTSAILPRLPPTLSPALPSTVAPAVPSVPSPAQTQPQVQPLATMTLPQLEPVVSPTLNNKELRQGFVIENTGKPRVASILRKREPTESALPELKRQKIEVAAASGRTGGWLDSDINENVCGSDDGSFPAMKARDPRRSLVEGHAATPPEGTLVLENSGGGSNSEEALHPELQHILEGMDDAERDAFLRERQRRMNEHEKMINEKKLCLVLDLDHTLLNSAKFAEIEPEWDQFLRAAEVLEKTRERRELYRFPHMAMWTKLRPGIWRFLSRASELYELHLYTMGNKAYATEMAKLLDPAGTMFSGRVISKGDDGAAAYGDEKVPKSKDLDGVLGMESAALIIDDSTRVWPHHRDNLIVVERYMYFPSSRRQFGLGGPSLLEVGHDEREADGMLASVLAVIERVHCALFSRSIPKEVDAREILALEQRSILKGCKIVFSRIFPVGEVQPQLHPLWRVAEQFGAVCSTSVDDDVTHVVAISMGTDKVNWALASGKHLVRPGWLEASTILYRRANERDFPVPP